MVKLTATISKEDLRRVLELPSAYTVTDVRMEGDNIICDVEARGVGVKTKVSDLTEILRLIGRAIDTNKEIVFEYYNEKRDAIEITNRKFIPSTWINEDCIEGFDLEKKAVRRFCPSRMNWVESV